MDLDKRKRERAAARGWLTREINKLNDLVKQENVSPTDIQTRLEQVEKRMEILNNVQSEVEQFLETKEFDADIDEAGQYIDNYTCIKAKAQRLMNDLTVKNNTSENIDQNLSLSTSGNSSSDVNLPKIQLPKFDGNPLEFFSFWERFNVAVDSTNIAQINKFIYLNSVLVGEALSAIKGLAITPENYVIAKDILTERFGRKEKVVFHHVEHLLTCDELKTSSNIRDLWQFRDEVQCHIRALQALGRSGEDYGVFLTPIILSKLPGDIRLEWARSGEGHESDISFLMDFLFSEINRKERSQMFQRESKNESGVKVREERKGYNRPKTVSAFVAHGKTNQCVVCEKVHKGKPDECFKWLRSSKFERLNILKNKNLCFACLNKGHQSKDCTSKCTTCSGKHHYHICNGTKTKEEGDKNENSSGSGFAGLNHTLFTNKVNKSMLQVIRVDVLDKCGNKKSANMLFDSGSDHTYVATELVKQCDLKRIGQMAMSVVSFGGDKPSPSKVRNTYSLQLVCENGSTFGLDATEIPIICAPVYKPKLPDETLSFLNDFDLNLELDKHDYVKIDILLGMDYLWHVLSGNIVHVPKTNLVVQKSIFGWVLSGSFGNKCADAGRSTIYNQLHCCVKTENMLQFENMWELDSIGISGSEEKCNDDQMILDKFEQNITFEDGRYNVSLPWKNGTKNMLLNNEVVAKKRLDNLMKRMNKSPQLFNDYLKVFDNLESDGICVEVPNDKLNEGGPIYYMPHHPVVKESSLSTKIRPVFDASCVGENGISLNDCLEAGPCLLPDLIGVIIRFRRWPVALTADIKQAFLNIRVHEIDTDVHRFLLPMKNSEGVRVMKLVRVPFGNKSSPFLLNATIKHHLNKFNVSNTVTELRENLYVDDLLSGTNNVEDCMSMITEACEIMSDASLPLAKWASNDVKVNQQLNSMATNENCLIVKDNAHRVLGVQWDKELDCLVFDGLLLNAECSPTKRGVLSVIARMFDPLGLLSPFIMGIKILFQDIWKAGYKWDEILPDMFRERLDKWMSGLSSIQQTKINRQYFEGEWSVNKIKCLYAFSDASERAYGACVYITVQNSDGACTSSLVYAKAKVAPIKSVSLPRLELLGALLAARLMEFVKNSLHIGSEVPVVCFTDSMVALSWIKGSSVRWKTFVRNRVEEIKSLVPIENWFHVHGKENPADLVSRGVSGQILKESGQWFNGPAWLGQSPNVEVSCESAFGDCNRVLESEDDRVLSESVVSNQLTTTVQRERVFVVSRWGKFLKAVRVVAWVHRFIRNARARRLPLILIKGELELSELKFAELSLLKHEQSLHYQEEINDVQYRGSVSRTSSISGLIPFLGIDGLLRTRRRLEYSDLEYDEKYPVLLPKCALSELMVRHCHIEMTHAGVDTMITAMRRRYWIVGVRRLAKRVKSQCIPCQIQDVNACKQMTAPLPSERVQRSNPFAVCGVDYAGPLVCTDSPGKKYILLFVCAVVRAVHVELVDSLSVDDFLLGFTRFVCRRSLPNCIISDNAKTFQTAKMKLMTRYGPNCPEWRFNAPLSPWWGAFWERMVKSIKANLRKSVGNSSLTRSELETTLHEVESCVNSRPLTFVGDNIDSVHPLTPSHFLTPSGGSGVHDPISNEPVSDRWGLNNQYSNRCGLIEGFWKRWSDEYLRSLPTMKASLPQGAPNVGSLVLIRDNEYLKRLQWPLGVVTQVFPGRDGLVRTIEVRTSKGKVIRPIQRIHVLETLVDDSGKNDERLTPNEKSESTNASDYVSRSGRICKPRNVLDL